MVKHNTDTNGIGYEWEYAKVKDDRTIWQKIVMGIYNPSSHEFLGRSAKSWGKVHVRCMVPRYGYAHASVTMPGAACSRGEGG